MSWLALGLDRDSAVDGGWQFAAAKLRTQALQRAGQGGATRHRVVYHHQRVDIFVSRDREHFIWSYRIVDGDFVMSTSPRFIRRSHALAVAAADARHRIDQTSTTADRF